MSLAEREHQALLVKKCPTYLENMKVEAAQLYQKLTNLDKFMTGMHFGLLPEMEKQLMEKQRHHMMGYFEALSGRTVIGEHKKAAAEAAGPIDRF